ncbi:acyl-CoA dehydrogenase family protein [Salinifilum aidingensis]
MDTARLTELVTEFLAEHDPAAEEPREFLRARFDAGLAAVHHPPGLGGLDAPQELQEHVDALFAQAGAPDNDSRLNTIGLGMAAPTVLQFGDEEQRSRYLRPLWTGEEIWCQLFSEPGAGSDLAAVATRATRDGDDWIVEGQKVWTSLAHHARWALLLARTDPDRPKHGGLTYFICDMTAPEVDVRPLRQITGEAEFNEIFLNRVRIPDAQRIGEVGQGWQVALGTLMNERVAIGGSNHERESGMIGALAGLWRADPGVRGAARQDRLLRLWVEAEAARLTSQRLRQQIAVGAPGPEGSAAKLTFARLNQEISGMEVEIRGADGLHYDDWTFRRPDRTTFTDRGPGYRYLRAKGNSIEGGTSEVLRNIIAERVLGLPGEQRVDKDVPWKELPR